MNHSTVITFCVLCATTIAGAIPASGQEGSFTTEPVGFCKVDCPAASDTRLSVTFYKALAFQGAVEGLPADNMDGTATIPVFGNPGWSVNQFTAPRHYVRILSGAKCGRWYDVTANGPSDLTIDLAGDVIDGLADDDAIKVIEHWTLDSLLPPATQTTLFESFGDSVGGRLSQLLIPDFMSEGINNPPSTILFISNAAPPNGGWRRETPGGVVQAGDFVIAPDTSFIVRTPAGLAATQFMGIGDVETAPIVVPLMTQADASQDTPVGLIRPVPVKLDDLGLAPPEFVESFGESIAGRLDQLFVYDNGVAVINKPPNKIYYKDSQDGSKWKLSGGGSADRGMEELPRGAGFVIRKVTADGSDKLWKNVPNYPPNN